MWNLCLPLFFLFIYSQVIKVPQDHKTSKIYKPICIACSKEMRCQKNDFFVVRHSSYSTKQTQWHGDLFSCPQCSISVAVGFGCGYVTDNKVSSYDLELA
jgi:hypothetical protein